MAWAVREHSKTQVDEAGKLFAGGNGSQDELDHALQVISNWRSCHSFPLNTLQVTLRRLARRQDPSALVAQRIKRLSSISHKLERYPTMKLSQMQDIGGCRAVVSTVSKAQAIRDAYLDPKLLRHRHHLVREDDYIESPKASGYRGIHLIFRYRSDRKQTYNGLQIEIQLRSKLEHAWATAVETVGTFLEQALKSSQGSDRWLSFFSLMGSAMAIREKRPLVPGTPTVEVDLKRELRDIVLELNVNERLTWYGRAVTIFEKTRALPNASVPNAYYYLLELRPKAGSVTVSPFTKSQLQEASAEYLKVERSLAGEAGSEAVLVSVESVEALRRAYPNYFLDTKVFLAAVEEAIA